MEFVPKPKTEWPALTQALAAQLERWGVGRRLRAANRTGIGTLMLGSDYGGNPNSTAWQTYAFIVSTDDQYRSWIKRQLRIRKETGLGSRRMKFSDAWRDKKKRAALGPMLENADSLRGLLVVVAVPREVKTLFPMDIDRETGQFNEGLLNGPLEKSSRKTKERLLIILNLAAFLLEKYSQRDQEVHWITDSDDIWPSEAYNESLGDVLQRCRYRYANHEIRNLSVIRACKENLPAEEYASLADLAAGVVETILSHSKLKEPLTDPSIDQLLKWLANSETKLEKLVLTIRPKSDNEITCHRLELRMGDYPMPIKRIRGSKKNAS